MVTRMVMTGRCLILPKCLFILLLASVVGMGAEREKLPGRLRTNGKETLLAVADLAERVRSVTVTILDDEEVVALGTVVRSDGWVATKASEVGWKTLVRLSDGSELIPQTVIVDQDNDLALLKLAQGFDRLLETGSNEPRPRGKFLLAPGDEKGQLKLGIVSANRRSIERVGGALGVLLGPQGLSVGGVEVQEVYEDTAAAKAGILQGDVIRSVNEKSVLLREQVIEEVGAHHPGERIRLALKRGDASLDLEVVLGFRSTYFRHLDRNQRLSGETSTRSSGFHDIVQHDIPVDVNAMGGPLVDLEGRLVGVNIARSDRVSTYALTVALVQQILSGIDG